jgi:hypothetical protein
MSTSRDTFVARFGEDQAAAVEAAGKQHMSGMFGAGVYDGDNRGSDEFRYWFLAAIGYECVTRFRDNHGITANVDEMKDWAKFEGRLGDHDGDIPDYISVLAGAYGEWISADAASWTAAER